MIEHTASCGCVVHLEAAGPHIYGGGLCRTADRLMRADPTVGTREDYRRHIARAVADAVRAEQAASGAEEDASDVAESEAAMADAREHGTIPWSDVEAEMALADPPPGRDAEELTRAERNQRAVELLRKWREHPSDEPLPEIEPVQFREVDVSDHRPKEEAPPTDTAERDAAYLEWQRNVQHMDLSDERILEVCGTWLSYLGWCAAWEARGQQANAERDALRGALIEIMAYVETHARDSTAMWSWEEIHQTARRAAFPDDDVRSVTDLRNERDALAERVRVLGTALEEIEAEIDISPSNVVLSEMAGIARAALEAGRG